MATYITKKYWFSLSR